VGPENAFGVRITPGSELRGLVGVGGVYGVQVAVIKELRFSVIEKFGCRGARK